MSTKDLKYLSLKIQQTINLKISKITIFPVTFGLKLLDFLRKDVLNNIHLKTLIFANDTINNE